MNGDIFGLFIIAFVLSLGWHCATIVLNNIIGHTNAWLMRRARRKLRQQIEVPRSGRIDPVEPPSQTQNPTFPIAGAN